MSRTVLQQILSDLLLEGDQLRTIVGGLDEAGWRTPTPAPGWDVATTIAHLAWTDGRAIDAATDKEAWDEGVLEAVEDPDGWVDTAAVQLATTLPTPELLEHWDEGRRELAEVLLAHEGKLPWFGPPMSPASMATARLMETWAHALDVYDALGLEPERSDRVRHVCHLGVRTRDFAFQNQGLTPPAPEFRIDLVAPSGEQWSWGPEDAEQTVTGSAWDFARLVTRRTHRDDTDLQASGADAEQWLGIAQAFAGPPGPGRPRAASTTGGGRGDEL